MTSRRRWARTWSRAFGSPHHHVGADGSAQLLAEQPPAQARQEGEQGRRLDQAAAERVGHGHVARPHRLHQPRHAEERVAAQLQRIAIVVVQPAQDHVHRLKTAEHLEINAVVAHRQIAALDQGVAEVLGEEGVLEIGLVVRPRREQDDARVVAVVRGDGPQRLAEGVEEAGQPLHLAVAENVRQDARQDEPVLQGVARPGRRLRAVAEHPEAAIVGAAEVGGVEEESASAGRPGAVTGPQEAGVFKDQFRRQKSVEEQALRAVEVVEDRLQKPRPLHQPRFKVRILRCGDQERDGVECPRPGDAARVAVDVVGDAVLADQLAGLVPAARHLAQAEPVECVDEPLPRRPHFAAGRDHFVLRRRTKGRRRSGRRRPAARRASAGESSCYLS